jgi:hypothetical protein
MKTAPGIVDIIKGITSNRESGRLEIHASGTHGVLLFNEGQLVDARLGSLNGFQAVNAAVSLRDVQFDFDHVVPALHSSTITPSERVVLKQFFGIEAAEMEEPTAEPDPDWNPAPEQVVPLAEVERRRTFSFLLRPRIAVALVLLLGLAAGVIALRSRMGAPQQSASLAATVDPQPPSVADSQLPSVPETREAPVQDLSGEWRVVNTVEKTAYKSFDNLQVGFRVKIDQKGNEFTASGEKFSENGQTLPANNRTPIRVTGSIDGDSVVATFVEEGKVRKTNGRFAWKLQNDELAGTFVSTAAKSSGKSTVTRQ